jgi:DNA-binding NarL/FixJ family response regulator
MKILLLDDHALFRAGLRLLLETLDHHAQILEAGRIAEALEIVAVHPDLQLCLLDLNLHHEKGMDLLGKLKSVSPDVTVVVVSSSDEASLVRACIDAGAMSFIPKSAAPEVLAEALKYVLSGDIYLPHGLFGSETPHHHPSPISLSPRQRDVLRGLCRGQSTKSIALDLALSEHTVKDYIAALFQLLAVHNRTEAVIEANRLRLLPEQR